MSTAKKMILAPKVKVPGMPGFLMWARRDNPHLYAALVKEFPAVALFEGAVKDADPTELAQAGMSGLFDLLSSFGSSIGSAASSVGSALSKSAGAIGTFVAKNAVPVLSAAVPLVVAKQQAKVAQAQVQLAQAQGYPMQTAYTTDPRTGYQYAVPVQQAGAGYGVANGQGYSVAPGFRQSSGGTIAGIPTTYLMIGGAALAALLLLRPSRS
jgi:hypothetical protein